MHAEERLQTEQNTAQRPASGPDSVARWSAAISTVQVQGSGFTVAAQQKIDKHAALVDLVDHEVAHGLEVGIALQPPQQDAGGDKAEPGLRAHLGLEPDLIPDGLADGLTALRSDSLGDPDRADPAGLGADYVAAATSAGSDCVL